MSDGDGLTHCPSCFTEHRAGYTICTVCGTLLVDGPSPLPEEVEERRPGSIEFGRLSEVTDDPDRFALEETPIVLTSIVQEDAGEFLAALDEQEIGARAGATTDDGGIEILIHASNLADAQAVLVEFTGEVQLIDHLGLEGDDDDLQVVTTARLGDAGRLAARLRAAGVDVRIDLPGPDTAATDPSASILVRAEELARARELLGIVA